MEFNNYERVDKNFHGQKIMKPTFRALAIRQSECNLTNSFEIIFFVLHFSAIAV